MSDYHREHDEHIAEKLLELGKSYLCICQPFIDSRFRQPPVVGLHYKITCPVHYPETAAVIAGDRDA